MCRISKALYQIALNLKDGQKIDCANLEPRAEEKGAIATTFHVWVIVRYSATNSSQRYNIENRSFDLKRMWDPTMICKHEQVQPKTTLKDIPPSLLCVIFFLALAVALIYCWICWWSNTKTSGQKVCIHHVTDCSEGIETIKMTCMIMKNDTYQFGKEHGGDVEPKCT